MYDVKLHYGTKFNICLQTNIKCSLILQYLDYEVTTMKKLVIIVENDIPFQMCKVVSRSTTTELWKVTTVGASGASIGGATGAAIGKEEHSLSHRLVTVNVDDVNDSPVFEVTNKQVTVKENVKTGHYLVAFTAKDPDINSANTVV